MAVYLFTFHAYRSWMPENRRGFVQRGRGIVARDPAMAERYRRRAKFERVMFSDRDCRLLLDAARHVCDEPSRRWLLHVGVAVFSHLHLLVSWEGFVDARRAKAVLHRALTVALRDAYGDPAGRSRLARGGSQKRVTTRGYFDHLCHVYLPAHRKYGGALLRP